MIKQLPLWASLLFLTMATAACSSGDLPSPEAPVINGTAVPITHQYKQGSTVATHNNPQQNKQTSTQSSSPKQITSSKPTPVVRTDWLWPVHGTVIANKHAAANMGIDIRTQPHSAVHAARAGEVVYAGSGIQGYGNLIIIKHGSEFLSAYAYNAKNLVHEGETVKAGQIIATVQGTKALPNVLHFEIRNRGEPVDPLQYLPKQS